MIDAFFEALMVADTEMQRQISMRELRFKIREVGSRCGDCNKWMKNRECPREHNVAGMSRGPSSGANICASFDISNSAVIHRQNLQQELAAMETKP